MAAFNLSCFPWAMADQLFIHQMRSAAVEPPWLKTDQTAIQLNWDEEVAEIIQIRLVHIERATRICRISFKPVYRREHDLQLVSGIRVGRFFASRLERRTP
jgi:hypothetical protein